MSGALGPAAKRRRRRRMAAEHAAPAEAVLLQSIPIEDSHLRSRCAELLAAEERLSRARADSALYTEDLLDAAQRKTSYSEYDFGRDEDETTRRILRTVLAKAAAVHEEAESLAPCLKAFVALTISTLRLQKERAHADATLASQALAAAAEATAAETRRSDSLGRELHAMRERSAEAAREHTLGRLHWDADRHFLVEELRECEHERKHCLEQWAADVALHRQAYERLEADIKQLRFDHTKAIARMREEAKAEVDGLMARADDTQARLRGLEAKARAHAPQSASPSVN